MAGVQRVLGLFAALCMFLCLVSADALLLPFVKQRFRYIPERLLPFDELLHLQLGFFPQSQ